MKAIYAGTFDPMTFGHLDIIERACGFCDELWVAIAQSKNKNPLFTLEERQQLIQRLIGSKKNVKVVLFEGLLAEFAKAQKIRYLIRGIRHENDFVFESQLAAMNSKLAPELETLWLPAKPEHLWVSATIVREIALMRGNLTAFVPSVVKDAIQQKLARL